MFLFPDCQSKNRVCTLENAFRGIFFAEHDSKHEWNVCTLLKRFRIFSLIKSFYSIRVQKPSLNNLFFKSIGVNDTCLIYSSNRDNFQVTIKKLLYRRRTCHIIQHQEKWLLWVSILILFMQTSAVSNKNSFFSFSWSF